MGSPSQFIFQRAVNLLAADTTTFASNSDEAPKMVLIKDAFVPSLTLTYADISPILADFTGYAAIGAATGTQNTAEDPLTSDYLLQFKAPVGGFRWETADASPNQTIYGWACIDDQNSNVYYSALFDTPIPLTGINQVVEIDTADIRYILGGVS